jgi:hypothetical protein
MDAALTLAVITAILQYGPSAVITISGALQANDNITAEDIKKLFILKEPGEYFVK